MHQNNVSPQATTYLSFKAAVHADHKGVVSKGQDVSLQEHLFYLVPKHQVLLADLLHGKALPRLLVTHQVHSSEVPTNILCSLNHDHGDYVQACLKLVHKICED